MLGFDHNLGGFNLVLYICHELLGKRRTTPTKNSRLPKKSFPHGVFIPPRCGKQHVVLVHRVPTDLWANANVSRSLEDDASNSFMVVKS